MKNLKALVLILILVYVVLGLSADKVTDFKLEDIKGKQVWLSEFQKDGLVILDFWATWCVPCKNGLPKLDEIHQKYDKVTVVTICTDKPRKKTEAKAYLKSNKFSFVSLFDPQGTVRKMFNVTNIPRTLIVAPDGEIIYDHTGYQRGDEKHYEEVVEKWLSTQDNPVEELDEKKVEPDQDKPVMEADKNAPKSDEKNEIEAEEAGEQQDK
ncbi:TlpA family protein disulfide reductase [Candidatus Cloacimonadota bacterium]